MSQRLHDQYAKKFADSFFGDYLLFVEYSCPEDGVNGEIDIYGYRGDQLYIVEYKLNKKRYHKAVKQLKRVARYMPEDTKYLFAYGKKGKYREIKI